MHQKHAYVTHNETAMLLYLWLQISFHICCLSKMSFLRRYQLPATVLAMNRALNMCTAVSVWSNTTCLFQRWEVHLPMGVGGWGHWSVHPSTLPEEQRAAPHNLRKGDIELHEWTRCHSFLRVDVSGRGVSVELVPQWILLCQGTDVWDISSRERTAGHLIKEKNTLTYWEKKWDWGFFLTFTKKTTHTKERYTSKFTHYVIMRPWYLLCCIHPKNCKWQINQGIRQAQALPPPNPHPPLCPDTASEGEKQCTN